MKNNPALFLGALFLTACTLKPLDMYFYGDPLPPSAPRHVFLIGIDGWGSYSIPKADMPAAKAMMAEGAYTLNAMDVLPSGSMPNWASMLYGTTPAFHGFTHNTTEPSFPQAVVDEYGYYPNIFALIHKKIPECQIAAFSEYGDIIKIVPPEVLTRAEKISGVEEILDYIENIDPAHPSFTFVQFDEADGAGHRWGHNSPEYYKTLTRIDAHVGRIREKAENCGLTDSATFILTADHGGFFLALSKDYMGVIFQHGGNTLEERQIPLIFSGRGIKKGPITGAAQIYDISPSVAALFDIPVPHVWLGNPVLQAFE